MSAPSPAAARQALQEGAGQPGAARRFLESNTGSGGRLLAVCTGRVAPLAVGSRVLRSAIAKVPVEGPVAVGPLGLAGDEQADPSVHGGLDKAVYAWPVGHHAHWQVLRARQAGTDPSEPLALGSLGENLVLEGVDETRLWVGDELHFPDCVLRVTLPRQPCSKFDAVIGYAGAGRDMVRSGRCGWYMAVDRPGTLQAGQGFSVVPGVRGLRIDAALAALRFKHLR